MKRLIVIFLVMLVGIFISFYFGRNIIAKTIISKVVQNTTGLELSMENIDVGILNTRIKVEGLKIYNPSNFVDRLMATIPEIYIDYDLVSFLRKKIHLEDVKLNLKEFLVIKNSKNELNLNSLKPISEAKKGGEKERAKAKKDERPIAKIDRLHLMIGKVIYKDYTGGTSSTVREYNLNIDEQFENITDLREVIKLLVTKSLASTAINKLLDFDLSILKDDLSKILDKGTKFMTETTTITTETSTGAAEEAQKTIKETIKELEKKTGISIGRKENP